MIKVLTMLSAAALMSAGTMAPVAASAQRTVVHTRTVVKHTGSHYGTRRVCKNEWRHHHRERVCRTVRYRR